MKKILNVLREMDLTVYQSDKFNLDSFHFDPFQDEGEEFERSRIFEKDNKFGKFVQIKSITKTSNFSYFLDGSRLTYKIGDIETTDHKFMPIVAGQIATGVCKRNDGKIKKQAIEKANIILLHSSINEDDLYDFKDKMKAINIRNAPFIVETYRQKNQETRPENFAIATIHKIMQELEIKMLTEMVESRLLKPEKMLVIDGSLQFMNKKADIRLFENVIGISKTYNPNLTGILKRKKQQIGTVLTKLEFGERTPVYEYQFSNSNRQIGAWYLRIRPKKFVKNPLDGIVKVEKIAYLDDDKEDGFDSGLIDNISQSILLERNVTSYGKETRWPNHLYAIHLTERMLKDSFLSSEYFLNLF
jgi:hypothetical protein